jgi:hypothetical protein
VDVQRGRWQVAVAITVAFAAVVFVQSSAIRPASAAPGDYNANAPGGSCVANWNGAGDSWGEGEGITMRSHCLLNTAPGTPLRIRFLIKGHATGGGSPRWYNWSFPVNQSPSEGANTPGAWDYTNWNHCGATAWGSQATDASSGLVPFHDIAPGYMGSCVYHKATDAPNQVLTIDTESITDPTLHANWNFDDGDWNNANVILRTVHGLNNGDGVCGTPFYQDAHDDVAWGWCAGAAQTGDNMDGGRSLGADVGLDPSTPPTIIADVCYDLQCTAPLLKEIDWQMQGHGSGDPAFSGGDPVHVPSSEQSLPDGHASDCKLDAISESGGVGVARLDWSDQSQLLIHFACYYATKDDANQARIVMWPVGHHGAPVEIPIPLETGNYRMPPGHGDVYSEQVEITKQSASGFGYASGLVIVGRVAPNMASFGGTCNNTNAFDSLNRTFALFAPCNLDHIFDWSFPVADSGNAVTFCANPQATGACNIVDIGHGDVPVTDPGVAAPVSGLGPAGSPGACSVSGWQYRGRDVGSTWGSWIDVTNASIPTGHVWSTSKEYQFQAQTVTHSASLSVLYGDDVPGESTHSDTVNNPPDGLVSFPTMTFRREGAWTVSWACTGTDGYGVDGLLQSGKDGTPYPGAPGTTGESSIGSCLSDAFGGVSQIDWLDPSTWVGALASALNPVSYAKASICVFKWAFLPTKPLAAYAKNISDAYAKTGVHDLQNAALTPFAAAEAFANQANTGDCHGPTVNFPVAGNAIGTHPLDYCGHAQMHDVAYVAETLAVYIGGAAVLIRMFASAIGVGGDTVITPSGSQNEGGPGQGSAGYS